MIKSPRTVIPFLVFALVGSLAIAAPAFAQTGATVQIQAQQGYAQPAQPYAQQPQQAPPQYAQPQPAQPQYAQPQPQYAQPQPQYVEPAPVPTTRHRIGLDVGAYIPLGDLNHITTVALGAQFRYEFDVLPQLSLSGRAGYFFHITDNDSTIGHIPFMAGVRYRFLEGASPYIAAELGLVLWHASVSVATPFGSTSGSDSEVELGTTLGAGYDFGTVDLRINVDIPDLDDADDTIGLSASVGFDFAEF